MSITARTIRPTDDSGQHATAGVRRQRTDEVADQVVRFVSVVVGFHVVKTNQQFIDVVRRSKKEVSCAFGDDEILREQLQHLFVVRQRRTSVVVGVAQPVQGLPRHANLSRREMGGRHVAHVVANRTVPEHRQLVFCTKNAQTIPILVSVFEFSFSYKEQHDPGLYLDPLHEIVTQTLPVLPRAENPHTINAPRLCRCDGLVKNPSPSLSS